MKLILVRHGETELNKNGLIQGLQDSPLNDTGRKQAVAAANALKDEMPFALYTSPLARAVETAGLISDAVKLPPTHVEGLREADTGKLDGLTGKQMREQYPEFMKRWYEDAGTAQMPGGESLLDVQKRAWEAITRICEKHPDKNVVAVSHNFTILTVIAKVLDMPINNFRRLRQNLGAISRIELTEDRKVLLSLNETGHLRSISQ